MYERAAVPHIQISNRVPLAFPILVGDECVFHIPTVKSTQGSNISNKIPPPSVVVAPPPSPTKYLSFDARHNLVTNFQNVNVGWSFLIGREVMFGSLVPRFFARRTKTMFKGGKIAIKPKHCKPAYLRSEPFQSILCLECLIFAALWHDMFEIIVFEIILNVWNSNVVIVLTRWLTTYCFASILCVQHSPFFTLFRPFFHVFLNFVFRFFLVSFVLCPSPIPLFDISTWRWLEASDVINDGDDNDVRSRRRLFRNVTPKMTPIDLLASILGLNLFVLFLHLCFKWVFSSYMYFYADFCMEFSKVITSISKTQLKSFSFVRINSYIFSL